MTKPIFVIVFVILSARTYSHQDVIYSANKDKIHLQYLSGRRQLEVDNKINIFLEIADRLIKNKFPNSEQLYIYFGHDYTKSDTQFYALGYGQFSFYDYKKQNPSIDIKTNGIKIIIRDSDFDIKRMLLLVNSAFSNIDYIKTNQRECIIRSKYNETDTLNSIQFDLINNYLATSSSRVDSILDEKYYRNINPVNKIWDIDYYFQNNKFHFYNTREPEKKWSEEQKKYIVTQTFGEDILITDNIFEIVGSIDDGHFIFINDSTFYFISRSKDKIRGPFKIDSIIAGRPPIRKYYHELFPIEKFILFIDNYDHNDKALFIPDSNILVSNYDKLENIFISDILHKSSNKSVTSKQNIFNRNLLPIIILCLMIFIWLMIRLKK